MAQILRNTRPYGPSIAQYSVLWSKYCAILGPMVQVLRNTWTIGFLGFGESYGPSIAQYLDHGPHLFVYEKGHGDSSTPTYCSLVFGLGGSLCVHNRNEIKSGLHGPVRGVTGGNRSTQGRAPAIKLDGRSSGLGRNV